MRSAPQSRLFAAISLNNEIVSSESFGFLARTLDLCFGEQTEKFTMEAAAASPAELERAPLSRFEPSWRGVLAKAGLSFDTQGV